MAFRHGKDTHFTLDETDISERLDDVSMPDEIEANETTVFGQGAHSYMPGLETASISLSGKYQADVEALWAAIKTKQRAGDLIPWVHGPEGTAEGRRRRTGVGVVESFDVSNPVGDVVTFSIDIQVSGPVTYDTFPA